MNPQKYVPIIVALVALSGALAGGTFSVHATNADTVYKAELSPLNEKTTGSNVTGKATLTITGDRLKIRVTVEGAPPNMEHLQHLHGFVKGGQMSRCPTASDDKNGDGIIDINETEPVAGTTMVPFHDDPVSMAIVNDTYPRAGPNGSYSYENTVSLTALKAAFTKTFPGQQLDLDRRVIFVHGVPKATKLPATAASLDHIPAQVTLPIACGEIKKMPD